MALIEKLTPQFHQDLLDGELSDSLSSDVAVSASRKYGSIIQKRITDDFKGKYALAGHVQVTTPSHTSHPTPHTHISHLTPHTSHLTPHTHISHLTPHTSHPYLTPHTSHLTPHTSHLTPHTSHITQQLVQKLQRSPFSGIVVAVCCELHSKAVRKETYENDLKPFLNKLQRKDFALFMKRVREVRAQNAAVVQQVIKRLQGQKMLVIVSSHVIIVVYASSSRPFSITVGNEESKKVSEASLSCIP